MQQRSSSAFRRTTGGWLAIAFGVLLLLFGIAMFLGGVWLIALGGAWYYTVAGIGFMAAALGLFVGAAWGLWVYFLTYVFTWAWALWEVGWDGWALVPWVVVPTIFAIIALCLIPVLRRGGRQGAGAVSTQGANPAVADRPRAPGLFARRAKAFAGRGAVLAVAVIAGALVLHATLPASSATPARSGLESGDEGPPSQAAWSAAGSDWSAYGGTNHALRYSTLDQINRGNVARLERAWTYRTGDLPDEKAKGKYSPETTPIKVGDRVYLCSAKNIMIALDAATGTQQWRFDPKVPDDAIPYGATCRGVAYYKDPNAATDQVCGSRILEATLDARLLAVDAKTGKPCADFGKNGTVDLTEGIGETVPGWYGNVAAPTIVRNVIVLGAQVKDGQAEDAPSGVIRGYDVITGKLASDGEPRPVHHGEHAGHALVFLADEEAHRAAVVAVDHGAGGRGMNAELVLDRMRAHIVAPAVRHHLGHQEQRDALGAGWRIGQTREHEMNDVVGQIVLAIGDENFRAGEAIGPVSGTFGLAAQRADVGAGLRLGELHGAHPFAADQLAEISLFEFVVAIGGQCIDRRHGQHRADAEGHGGGIPHLDAGGVHRVRQLLAAPARRRRQAVPAGRGPGRVGVLPAWRRRHLAVFERRAELVADGVKRCDHVGGEAPSFGEHRIDGLFVEIAVKSFGQRRFEAGSVLERKGDVGNRRAIGHAANLAGAQGGSTREQTLNLAPIY